jgi:hypothetical protein
VPRVKVVGGLRPSAANRDVAKAQDTPVASPRARTESVCQNVRYPGRWLAWTDPDRPGLSLADRSWQA